MKKIISLLIVIMFCGCSISHPVNGKVPKEVETAKRPIIIRSINDDGIVLVDGDGSIYVYPSGYYFAQAIMNSDLKAGDTLSPNKPIQSDQDSTREATSQIVSGISTAPHQ